MSTATDYEIVLRVSHDDTPLSRAPLFGSREKAETWAAKYRAENPDILKKVGAKLWCA
jgi:hypothetical protein